jgi:hypothetical protein
MRDTAGGCATRGEIDMIVVHTIGGPLCDPATGPVRFSQAPRDARFWRGLARAPVGVEHSLRGGSLRADRGATAGGAHSGHVSYAGTVGRVNEWSIGIELVNRGDGVDPIP